MRCAVKIAAWTAAWIVVWAAVEVLWMERHRRRASERDASRVWDGWVTVGFVGDDASELRGILRHPLRPQHDDRDQRQEENLPSIDPKHARLTSLLVGSRHHPRHELTSRGCDLAESL